MASAYAAMLAKAMQMRALRLCGRHPHPGGQNREKKWSMGCFGSEIGVALMEGMDAHLAELFVHYCLGLRVRYDDQ